MNTMYQIYSGGRRVARAIVYIAVALRGISDPLEAFAMPHPAPLGEDCLRAAESRAGQPILRTGEAIVRMLAEGSSKQLVYFDASLSETARSAVVRLYCTVDEQGRIEHFVTMPRLLPSS